MNASQDSVSGDAFILLGKEKRRDGGLPLIQLLTVNVGEETSPLECSGYNVFWGFGELHEKECQNARESLSQFLSCLDPNSQEPHETAAREAWEEVPGGQSCLMPAVRMHCARL